MHKSTLPLLALLAIGCSPEEPGGVVIADFRERSDPLPCQAVQLEDDLAITDLRTTSDSSWAVLDEGRGVIRGYDDRMEPLWTVQLEQDGPLGLPHPVGLAVAGDSVAYVVDRERFALATLDTRDGTGRSMPLEFIPAGVAALPDGGAVVTALPMGPIPRELVFLVEGDSLRALDVPQRSYADMSINGLGNMVLAEPDGSGALLVVHQFMEPRAFRVSPAGDTRALALPVPDGTAHKRTYIPVPPVTPETLPHIYVGASAISVDRGTGEVYLLTQSGHREADRSERAVMRMDSSLGYSGSYLVDLGINAGHMAYLGRRNALLLGDDVDRLHLCPLPVREGAESPAHAAASSSHTSQWPQR